MSDCCWRGLVWRAGLPPSCATLLPDEAAALACYVGLTLSASSQPRCIRSSGSATPGRCAVSNVSTSAWARLPLPRFSRWHLTSQDLLFGHLRQLWDDNVPRVMLDLGCHAGHTRFYNMSDSLFWLHHFNHSGSSVLGIDAFEDYALDLQARFDGVEPYRSMHGVERRALRLAVGNHDDALVNINHFARMAITCCANSWCSHWKQIDPVSPDHYCRITRQRVAALCPADECKNTFSHSVLPLPPSSYPDRHFRFEGAQRLPFMVPSMRTDTMWRRLLGGRTIDFLKIDVDRSWTNVGLDGLFEQRGKQRGFRLLLIEMDDSWGGPLLGGESAARFKLTQLDQLAFLARRHRYRTYLKVPCRAAAYRGRASGMARFGEAPGWSAWYHEIAAPETPFRMTAASSLRSSIGTIQARARGMG